MSQTTVQGHGKYLHLHVPGSEENGQALDIFLVKDTVCGTRVSRTAWAVQDKRYSVEVLLAFQQCGNEQERTVGSFALSPGGQRYLLFFEEYEAARAFAERVMTCL